MRTRMHASLKIGGLTAGLLHCTCLTVHHSHSLSLGIWSNTCSNSYDFLLAVCCSYVSVVHHFWDITTTRCLTDQQIWFPGHSPGTVANPWDHNDPVYSINRWVSWYLLGITNLNINWSWFTARYFVLIHSEIQELQLILTTNAWTCELNQKISRRL